MITTKKITDSWQAITSAGESGSVWVVETRDGLKGKGDVLIYHSDSGMPTGDQKIMQSKRLYRTDSNKPMLISADNGSDIFYARCMTEGSTVKINVDVV